MSFAFRAGAAVCALISSSTSSLADPAAKPLQYVIISFDGAHDLAQWDRSRALAKRTGASFTYFLSCVFLLSSETRRLYQAPGKGHGRSNVGFAATKDEVAARLAQIWAARAEGHEIGSHGCGHFDGKDWTRADWKKEFDAFATILRDAYPINGLPGEPAGWKDFATTQIHGFRAPYLSTNKALHQALAERRFAYDASGVSRGPTLPGRTDGMANFALPQIPEGPSERRVIAMDYNLFVRHSGGFEKADADAVFENRAYGAFKAAFDTQYQGERIPLQLGFHFTLMNDGAYWRALERFAGDVCLRAQVACVSYERYLEQAAPSPGAAPAVGIGG
ncbi:polysaccharide deacetylase [Mesorhizobium sp. L-8-3]|uniref:polysaccharide deacetylase n=1 Tax=Mesorhizobium sp. L-8-3 TaxID=2744522 RepID=UPI001927934C|nr:polysaccharide deacetylase [Mesorhizobium sp. L-8-3]BCH26234.1 polysaccharide deacetylase [Mesorhizobium sp. L-8-3]